MHFTIPKLSSVEFLVLENKVRVNIEGLKKLSGDAGGKLKSQFEFGEGLKGLVKEKEVEKVGADGVCVTVEYEEEDGGKIREGGGELVYVWNSTIGYSLKFSDIKIGKVMHLLHDNLDN